MRLMAKITTTVLAASIAGAGVAAVAAPANAATGSCGAGYRYLKGKNHFPIKHGKKVGGYADLYYNAGNGKNCAIVRAGGSGASHITVLLSRYDKKNHAPEKTVTDGFGKKQNFKSYAGPVKIWAAGRCITVVGSLKRGSVYYQGGATKVHCG
ncbi:hypothetical protein [Actinomadura nitritigenes]|uniref:hypothetical protein n=1 Tax=Actinomadura nitritigenes TaxID=134602 RepID=UPI003D8C80A8